MYNILALVAFSVCIIGLCAGVTPFIPAAAFPYMQENNMHQLLVGKAGVVVGLLAATLCHAGTDLEPRAESPTGSAEMSLQDTALEVLHAAGYEEVEAVRLIDVPPLEPTESFSVTLPDALAGQSRELIFEKVSVRGEGFRLLVQNEDGVLEEADPGPVRTFFAKHPDTGEIVGSGSLYDEGLKASFRHGGKLYEINPAHELFPLPDDLYTFKEAIAPSDFDLNAICGTPDGASPEPWATTHDASKLRAGESSARGGTQPLVVDITCEADTLFSNIFTSDNHTLSFIEGRINSARSAFWHTGVRYYLTTVVIWDGSDPYTSNSSLGLLNNLKSTTSARYADDPYHIGFLFTGKFVDGLYGRAMAAAATICNREPSTGIPINSYAYASPVYDGSEIDYVDMSTLTIHELGHLWNMQHFLADSDTYMLSPGIVSNPQGFSEDNIDNLETVRDNATCLERQTGDVSASCRALLGDDDLNRNYIKDSCELDDPERYEWPTLTLIPYEPGETSSTYIYGLPTAVSDVELTVTARGRFHDISNAIELMINGESLGMYTMSDSTSCNTYSEMITVDRDAYNYALSQVIHDPMDAENNRDIIEFIIDDDVTTTCSSPFVRLELAYDTRHRDADGDDILDEVEVIRFGEPDCNGNRALDIWEAEDCNGNMIPDDCDLAGVSVDCVFDAIDDCNQNGIIDSCEIDALGAYVISSPNLEPPTDSTPLEYVFEDVPLAAAGSRVFFELYNFGNMEDEDNTQEVFFDGKPFEVFYDYDPVAGSGYWAQSVEMSRNTFNTLAADGEIEMEIEADGFNSVSSSEFTYARFVYQSANNMNHAGSSPGNATPDSCEIMCDPVLDMDFNGILDEFDPDLDMDGIADHLQTDDCDNDGVPNLAEINGYTVALEPTRLSPVDDDVIHTVRIENVPQYISGLRLVLVGRGDLNSSTTEDIALALGDSAEHALPPAFSDSDDDDDDCDELSFDVVEITGSDLTFFLNAMASDGSVLLTLDPGESVKQFDSSCDTDGVITFLDVTVEYDSVPQSDSNSDDIPDICQDRCLEPSLSSVTYGAIQSGALSDTCGSDDVAMVVRGGRASDATTAWAQVQVEAVSTVLADISHSSFTFSFEGHQELASTTLNFTATIEAYDYDNDEYVVAYSGPLLMGPTDQVYSVTQDGSGSLGALGAYIDPFGDGSGLGETKARITVRGPGRNINPLFPTPIRIFDFHLDDVYWYVD